jgi:hypothetical protein
MPERSQGNDGYLIAMILERQILDCFYIGRSCASITLRNARTNSQRKEYKHPIQLHSNRLAIPHPPWSLPGTMMWNCCFYGQRMAPPGSSSANFLFRKYLTRTFIRLVIRERPPVLFLMCILSGRFRRSGNRNCSILHRTKLSQELCTGSE